MSKRLEALTGGLDTPLLVTNLTNILYLTGFESSNAALYEALDDGVPLEQRH